MSPISCHIYGFRGAVCCLVFAILANAQTFNSGSNGTDGALNITTTGRTVLDPYAMGLDADRDNVYNFTTVNIAAACTLRLGSDRLGTKPVYWLCSGDVTINGVIDISGENGHESIAPHRPAIAGAGGFNGGVGYQKDVCEATNGEGPGGGRTGVSLGNDQGSGAGYAIQGTNVMWGATVCTYGGKAYGNKYLLPIIGGSGGAGGVSHNGSPGRGGGAGGGALCIASSGKVTINGNIDCRGGCQSTYYDGHGAGGGSGGAVRVVANGVGGNGGINVLSKQNQICGDCMGQASPGRIRVETYSMTMNSYNFLPGAIFATPGSPLFPPTESAPQVRISSIDGIAVTQNPNGSFAVPDIVINKGDTALISIAAQNIPVGTAVNLSLYSETEGTIAFASTPLAGTLQNSNAQAKKVIPPGFSRINLEANW